MIFPSLTVQTSSNFASDCVAGCFCGRATHTQPLRSLPLNNCTGLGASARVADVINDKAIAISRRMLLLRCLACDSTGARLYLRTNVRLSEERAANRAGESHVKFRNTGRLVCLISSLLLLG